MLLDAIMWENVYILLQSTNNGASYGLFQRPIKSIRHLLILSHALLSLHPSANYNLPLVHYIDYNLIIAHYDMNLIDQCYPVVKNSRRHVHALLRCVPFSKRVAYAKRARFVEVWNRRLQSLCQIQYHRGMPYPDKDTPSNHRKCNPNETNETNELLVSMIHSLNNENETMNSSERKILDLIDHELKEYKTKGGLKYT